MCNINCVKYVLSFFTFISILIGVAGIIAGSILLGKQGGHLSYETFNPATAVTTLILVTGILSLFCGIVGIIGSKKKSKCCMYIFQVSVFPMLIISLVQAGFAVYVFSMTGEMEDQQKDLEKCSWKLEDGQTEYNCDACGSDSGMLHWIRKIDEKVFEITNQVYGHVQPNQNADVSLCPVQAKDPEQYGIYEAEYGLDVELKPEGYKSFNDCMKENKDLKKKYEDAANFMSFYEQEFKCSGFCTKTPYYVFYDSTITPTGGSCYQKIVDFYSSSTVLGISLGVAFFYLLQFILSFVICCHKSNKDKSAYQRMNYYE